jgi:hypothetical protein
VQGLVNDQFGAHGQPIGGATVRLSDESDRVVAERFTSQDGLFTVEAPKPGRYRLAIRAQGFFDVGATIVVKKVGTSAPFLRVELGVDAMRPCGGGLIVEHPTGHRYRKKKQ